MSQPKIFSFIKSSCGRTKYLTLAENKSIVSKLRLYWFIFFAILRDLSLKNPDHLGDSNS